ncbi:hypothetical protein [Kistimonas asteriae]|uniref:hypothetical protein n=1 Tax=Kistimonas asteriae TaxID=517724 RepID=UPI001BA442CD|nr:hypothetical protein [Kistimonas asteriae]
MNSCFLAQPGTSFRKASLSYPTTAKQRYGYLLTPVIQQALDPHFLAQPSHPSTLKRKLCDFAIATHKKVRAYFSDPATADRIRLAFLTFITLLAISALIYLLFLGIGALLLNSLAVIMAFSVCCSIPGLLLAAIYVPIYLREQYPCRPRQTVPSAPPLEPEPPYALANVQALLQNAKACTEENFEPYVTLMVELYALGHFKTFERYHVSATWLHSQLLDNPTLKQWLLRRCIEHDRNRIQETYQRSLTLDDIGYLLQFIKADKHCLSTEEKSTLCKYIGGQLCNYLSSNITLLHDEIDKDSFENILRTEAHNIDTLMEEVFQLSQFIHLCDTVTDLSSSDNESFSLQSGVREYAFQRYQKIREPFETYCTQKRITWFKAPLIRAIRQHPLIGMYRPFDDSIWPRLNAIETPAINLVDNSLVDYTQLQHYLNSCNDDEVSWISPITGNKFAREDIICLDKILPIQQYRTTQQL